MNSVVRHLPVAPGISGDDFRGAMRHLTGGVSVITAGHGKDITVVAYPSVYRSSGVMTFIAGQHATVYAKDLGTDTTELAKGIKRYHPDKSWRKEAAPAP